MNHEPEHGSGSHHSHSQQENLTGESNHAETTHDTSDHNQPHNMHDSHAAHHGHGQLSGELNAAKVLVEWTSNPEPIQSNQETDIFLDVKDASGKAVEIFSTVHEKEMHLLAIKRDLSVFKHLHPDYLGKGRFQIKTTFPKAGRYKLYADFLPEGRINSWHRMNF